MRILARRDIGKQAFVDFRFLENAFEGLDFVIREGDGIFLLPILEDKRVETPD